MTRAAGHTLAARDYSPRLRVDTRRARRDNCIVPDCTPARAGRDRTGFQGADLAVAPTKQVESSSVATATQNSANEDFAFAQRIASGEAAAMREAVELFLPQIHATARRMLNNDADAEEVAQETFLRVWKSVGTWTPKGARLRTWVVRVTMNLCYDRLRRKGHGKSTPLDEAPDPIDERQNAIDDLAEDDRSKIVERAMCGLPDRQRAAIHLVHFDEMTNIEAAGIMDVSVDALESLLARGRRSLKKALLAQKQELLGEL